MSYSSFGVADGGSVASWAPGALVSCTGGNCDGGIGAAFAIGTSGCAGALPASVERSSGAPGARPPGAPIGGSLAAFWGGGTAASLPSTRGAPGAFGYCAGLNTSERLPGAAAGGALTGVCGGIARGAAPAGGPPLEPSCCKRYSVSSCIRLSCISSCWLRYCNCSSVPVSWRSALSMRLVRWTRVALALLRWRLAAAEQVIKEAAGRTLLLRRRGAGQQQQGQRG